MDRSELIEYIQQSNITNSWHWYGYHFNMLKFGIEHPFSKSILDALLNINNAMDGYAFRAVDTMGSLHGKEKYLPHYDQLKQFLAEVFVVNHLVIEFPDAKFSDEPTVGNSKKNPEVTIQTDSFTLGVEVKSPRLREHVDKRNSNPVQIPGRMEFITDLIEQAGGKENVTLPRDNPVKDFLISADEKFAEFKKHITPFYSVLVIVWDDYIYEPITSLVAEHSGLLTDNSFAKDEDGKSLLFNNIDAVITIRQLHQFQRAAGGRALIDGKKHALDYGSPGEFPFKVICEVPGSEKLPETICTAFQAVELDDRLGAEYRPQEYIMWM